MERTITFIAEHKKREYEQVKDQAEIEVTAPLNEEDVAFDPEPHAAEY